MSEKVAERGLQWRQNTGAIVCRHVFEGRPVRLCCYEHDRDLQLMCGTSDHWVAGDFQIAELSQLFENHPEMSSLPEMNPGQSARRPDENSNWIIGELAADNHNEGLNP